MLSGLTVPAQSDLRSRGHGFFDAARPSLGLGDFFEHWVVYFGNWPSTEGDDSLTFTGNDH